MNRDTFNRLSNELDAKNAELYRRLGGGSIVQLSQLEVGSVIVIDGRTALLVEIHKTTRVVRYLDTMLVQMIDTVVIDPNVTHTRTIDLKSQSPYHEHNYNAGRHSYGTPQNGWGVVVEIGKYTSIGVDCRYIGSHHPPAVNRNAVSNWPFADFWKTAHTRCQNRGKIVIGSDVWIGEHVTILDNVRIGDGAIVGAGAVVSRDVQPYTVVAGNPARMIRYRFPIEVIVFFRQLQWWDWPDDVVRYFSCWFDDIDSFIAEAKRVGRIK